MGVDTRKPLLPAPTDSSAIESNGGSVTPTDLATDISRRTDRTSHTVPDDGRPITINTGKKRSSSGKLSKSHHHSQTSLLIEYFEAGKGQDITSRPSVRVKVRPSTARKAGQRGEGEIVVTEARGSRKPSYRRRISLGAESPKQTIDTGSISSFSSLSEESRLGHRATPLEVEILRKEGSELSGTSVSKAPRFIVPTSDISSMPADSMLEGNPPSATIRPDRSRSLSREEIVETNRLKAPARRRSRSLSRERLTQKVLEKLANRPRDINSSSRRRHEERSGSHSMSKEVSELEAQSHSRLSGKQPENASVSTGPESSVLTNSALSANRKSGDQISFRSGTSKSSVNNPKLLDAFEDVLRRVIIPELKELKKDKKTTSHRNKFEKMLNQSDISGSSASQEEVRRRVSKTGSAPEMKTRNSSGKDSSGSRRREKRRKETDLDSPSERSFPRRESGDSLSLEEDRKHQRSSKDHGLRNAAAGALVGGVLTAAALEHHDSRSSLDRRERRRKQSKSRSRSASIAETEDIFEKHGVPPMPMRSDIETELTRSSLLSDQTATASTQRELREVPQGSPREILCPTSKGSGSPAVLSPTKTPANLKRGLGTYHGNLSNRDLSSFQKENYDTLEDRQARFGDSSVTGTAAAGGSPATSHLLADEEQQRRYESNLHHQHPIRRGLSPIQSVASYNTSEPNRNSMKLARSSNSLASLNKEHQIKEELSIESLSSAPSTNLARSKRPEGISLETGSEVLGQLNSPSPDRSKDIDAEAFFDEQHSENERYRASYATSDPKIDYRRLTVLTDDSLDTSYLDKTSSGQQVTRGHGANPEYVHTPPGVESAVASLYDPSLESVGSTRSSARSPADSIERQKLANQMAMNRDVLVKDGGSPLKKEYTREEKSFQQRMGATSPPQSITSSQDDRDEPLMGISGVPVASDPMPEIGVGLDSPQSEITTNPSVIHGPIGGSSHGNRDHWPYSATPPKSKGGLITPAAGDHGLGINEATLAGGTLNTGLEALDGSRDETSKNMPAGLDVHYDTVEDYDQNRDSYMTNQSALTPPKDEGYISAANPGTYSPDPKARGLGDYNVPAGRLENTAAEGDPFMVKHIGHERAKGKGIESIQSKDVVALMDHLTVRDAQRNARDTEILVTLVRSAAEMRNSFEDMKRFIADQDDLIMDTADRQHDKTVQKVISGPRPQPLGTSRFPLRTNSEEEEDTPSKRQNVFKRALRGLSTKNTAELQNIEGMLMRLLGEVEGLRADQEGGLVKSRAQSNSMNSAENAREPTDPGYEPEGQAGTSSTGDRSGFFSNNSSRQADHRGAAAGHRDSNRVSTVMEGDEDLESLKSHEHDVLNQQLSNGRILLSAARTIPDARDARDARDRRDTTNTTDTRGSSLPFNTPQRNQAPENRAFSNENTPQMSSDGKAHRKNKSISSSFYPKIMSRWSKTTASSIVDNFRGSTQVPSKARPYSQVSQSGSNLNVEDYDYDPREDALRSTNSYLHEQYAGQEHRPASPLIPSQVSDNPKYHAHRNSQNLQHPQPRQAPTGRYQHHLDNEAQTYGGEQFSPTSQTSSLWGNQQGLSQGTAHPQQRYSGYSGNDRLSPISDAGYSESSSAMMELGEEEHERSLKSGASANSVISASGQPRRARARDNEPLVPQRPPKVPMSPAGSRQANYVDHVSAARAGSPAFDKSPVAALRSSPGQARKPSGPRPQAASGQYSPGYLNNIKRTRYRGSPNQVDSTDDLR